MTRLIDLWLKILQQLRTREWIPQLLVRLAVGGMFCGSGFNKLRNLDDLIAYFENLGIPLASVQAPMVASIECVGGALLMIGLATRMTAAALCGVMVVALATARLQEENVSGLLDFLYLNEWLLFLILFWYVFSGAGPRSIDAGIAARFSKS